MFEKEKLMGKVKLHQKTLTQSVSNHSSQLYYTTFLVFSKINITKFQKINIIKKKLKKSDLNKNGVIVHYYHTQK